MTNYQETEELAKQIFKAGEKFSYEDQEYTIEFSGKPRPAKGECKTDLYVLTKNYNGEKREFKFSIKKDNYQFLENKINSETAEEIFGPDFKKIISEQSTKLTEKFNSKIKIKKDENEEIETIPMGWKLEIFKDTSGVLATELDLGSDQLRSILTGEGRSESKINCKVNGEEIKSSGIANLMLILPEGDHNLDNTDLDYLLSKVMTIDEHLEEIDINARYTALNFRAKKLGLGREKGKWDSNRPLAVWVDWVKNEGKLEPSLVVDEPFKMANEIGKSLRNLLWPKDEEIKETQD